jgi:hypothetical protein
VRLLARKRAQYRRPEVRAKILAHKRIQYLALKRDPAFRAKARANWRAAQRAYRKTARWKAWRRAYDQRPDVKARERIRAKRARPRGRQGE